MKAFPCEWVEIKPNTIPSSHVSNYQEITHKDSGMDLRDYFAAKAMQLFLGQGSFNHPDAAAKLAYEYADSMMEARK